jgi:hypothetical protein
MSPFYTVAASLGHRMTKVVPIWWWSVRRDVV